MKTFVYYLTICVYGAYLAYLGFPASTPEFWVLLGCTLVAVTAKP